ncbi:cation transporting ATPase C-terminal domain-containing protein [Hymenobacter actinosclerus]|uniref:Cation-transporting P-type ATPase C-terminal domain-containing protein n=1 Tax=Hymenobacter actinosclerus TaxID=82805 RepID=A0A1I0DVK2_9BACT|nr:cation transporting ATPase C-terminal domain-containing protein [Hymenobacter actinosclerus]SET36369.1 hypothetical protein SAMN04487998_1576 [Hymenobacter actinosclerus]
MSFASQPATSGLCTEAVAAAHGRNVLPASAQSGLLATLRDVVLEPMFLLLLAACAVYIGLHEWALQRRCRRVLLFYAAGCGPGGGEHAHLRHAGIQQPAAHALVNRSFTQSVFRTLRVPNRILWLMLGLTLALLLLVTLLVPAARQWFGFVPVPAAALVGVGRVEVYKAIVGRRNPRWPVPLRPAQGARIGASIAGFLVTLC